MTNKNNGVLYIGSTDNIVERVKEHKLKNTVEYLPRGTIATYSFILKNMKLEKKPQSEIINSRNGSEIGKLN
jgi:predicted GIY-YIG superfamily endonuclease